MVEGNHGQCVSLLIHQEKEDLGPFHSQCNLRRPYTLGGDGKTLGQGVSAGMDLSNLCLRSQRPLTPEPPNHVRVDIVREDR